MTSVNYILSRTVQAVITMFAVISFSFAMIRWLPGGPEAYLMAQYMGDDTMSDQRLELLIEQYLRYVPDDPLHVQYWQYMTSLLQGDLGISVWYQEPVMDIIVAAMPWTIYLSAVSLAFMYVLGIGLGAVMAYKEKTNFDVGMSFYSIIIQAFPYYVFAVLLLWVFSYSNSWFPIGGRYGPYVTPGFNLEFILSVAHYSILPILSLVIIGFGGVTLGMRANSIRVLGEDFIRVAQLRGLSDSRIALSYVGRNAVLPMYTNVMISLGSLFGGSVILETLFNYPGMGYYMYEAVMARDYPLMMGSFLFITLGVVVGVYLADLSYGYIDPRAGTGGSRESFSGDLSSPIDTLRKWARSLRVALGGKDVSETKLTNGAGPQAVGGGGIGGGAGGDTPFELVSDKTPTKKERYMKVFDEWVASPVRILWGDWRARVGMFIILVYVFAGTVGVVLTEPPRPLDHPTMALPFQNTQYILGTDGSGRNILTQLIHSTPTMFRMMIGGAVYATLMAAVWGTFSGYIGGRIDRIMMTISDILITVPGLPLVIVLSAILEPRDPYLVGVILTINGWAGASRNWRSQVLTLRVEPYVEASRMMGLSTWRILTKDILPKLAPLIMVRFVELTRSVISSSVALYFLGILPFTTLNWGVMLNMAYGSGTWYTMAGVHWILAPIVTIVVLGLGLILFGQACDHILNPRIRAKHSKHASSDDTEGAAPE